MMITKKNQEIHKTIDQKKNEINREKRYRLSEEERHGRAEELLPFVEDFIGGGARIRRRSVIERRKPRQKLVGVLDGSRLRRR